MKAVIIGMAKGRTEFLTIRGRSGAGKRVSSELDLLRLIYAATKLQTKGMKVFAYILVLCDSGGRSTKATLEKWLEKYEATQLVEIWEKQLSDKESISLRKEKYNNAAAQAREGGSAIADLAKKYAEDKLHEYIKERHPDAIPAQYLARPFMVNWDAWYLIP